MGKTNSSLQVSSLWVRLQHLHLQLLNQNFITCPHLALRRRSGWKNWEFKEPEWLLSSLKLFIHLWLNYPIFSVSRTFSNVYQILKNSAKVSCFDFILYCIAFLIFVSCRCGFWDQPTWDQSFRAEEGRARKHRHLSGGKNQQQQSCWL